MRSLKKVVCLSVFLSLLVAVVGIVAVRFVSAPEVTALPKATEQTGIDFASFACPDGKNRPETWFHLIGGNVAKAGLDADFDAIKAAGIAGVQLFHGSGRPWPGVSPQIQCLSADWDDLVAYAADACAKRGLSFKMQNCPGWSMSGGPWITLDNNMRHLSYSRKDVPGGTLAGELPTPSWILELEAEWKIGVKEFDYRDLFVLAFPTPAGDDGIVHAPKPVAESDENGVMRRRFEFKEPICVQTLELPSPSDMNHANSYTPDARVKLVAVDGTKRTTVLDVEIPQGVWQDRVPISFACDAQTARVWEFEFTHKHPVQMDYIRFHSGVRLNNWEALAGWVLRGFMKKKPVAKQDQKGFVKADRVLDLTDKFKDGKLNWTAPAGEKWTVLRIGHVNNCMRNGPAPKEATGWECNKMDRSAVDLHFDSYIGRLAKGPLAGGKLKGFIVDSWECRRQTWTASLEQDFRKANGYDFRKKLPAVFGWVLDDLKSTEAFLLDWRRTLAELIETNYYLRLCELAREHGLSVQYETAYGDVLPGDLMSFWKWCDTPMCEVWHPRTADFVGQDEFKPVIPCASATHVYGKKSCAAEAFTTVRLKWNEEPKAFKRTANHAFARGVTHAILHTYTHQPLTNGLPPGSSFGCGVGSPFIRGQTWWNMMKDFTDYLARCEMMLEAGKPCSDVLWFLGDEVGHKPPEKSPLLEGFHYDYCNPDALLTRVSTKDGKIVLPDGVQYEVLWVPTDTFIAPKSEAKLRALAAAGARVVRGTPAEAVAGLKPDLLASANARAGKVEPLDPPLEWIHRTAPGADWYFVSANAPEGYKGEVSFRSTGPAQLWDPVTGEAKVARTVAAADGRTTISFDFASGESAFVVFGDACTPLPVKKPTARAKVESISAWTLSFPDGWGAPKSLTLNELKSWTELPIGEEGQNFSGTATYTASVKASAGGTAVLDLGRVESVATVFVNGQEVRKLWSSPYRCEITLAKGDNDLRVAVANTWFNRLAYDEGLPLAQRKTWTIAAPKKDAPRTLSGLLGPVSIETSAE